MGIQTVSKTIDLQSPSKVMSKHITEIGDSGIKVHATEGANLNYVEIDSDGLEIYKNGDSVASYGDMTKIGKDNEKHIEVLPNSFNVYDEDGSMPFSVSTENSLTTWTHGYGVNLTASSGSYKQSTSNVFLKGRLVDNKVYFGVSTSSYPTAFNNYVTLPSSPSSYPTAFYSVTIDGVECKARWQAPSTIYIYFNNTSNSAKFPAMQITEEYYETWIKANDAQLKVNYERIGLVDSAGTSDTATTYARTYGHLVSVAIGVYNTNSIANNGIVYRGNLMNLVPSVGAVLVGYRGGFVYGYIASNGAIAVYNATGGTITSSSSQPVILYGTYIMK